MQQLLTTAKQLITQKANLPFSVYSSVQEQHIVNVPIIKPLLICVLDGCKQLGQQGDVNCNAGSFVFLSNSPKVEMRNIPLADEYFALLIMFEYEDFDCFKHKTPTSKNYFQGDISSVLQQSLQQFVEWSVNAPEELWALRRQEILQLLYLAGHHQLSAIVESPSIGHRLFNLVIEQINEEVSAESLCAQLAMSESTLRRKLQAEGTSLQAVKDSAKLGYGLHLIQTTLDPIGSIAEQCGYQSQSRFTDRFKSMFGMTPRDLRKTRLTD